MQTARSKSNQLFFDVAPGVWGSKDIFVNFYFVESREQNSWVLIDAGLKCSYSKITKIAKILFDGQPPAAILLTHGHFDHTGALEQLIDRWQVPVYAHQLELPYLRGASSYPPPDPSVGGGMMSAMSWMYPKKPLHLGSMAATLPMDHTVPGLPDWKWVFTPGHSPGHVSFYREADQVLLAGDAFVTTKAESAISIWKQKKLISGPPKYFTPDWLAAANSVKKLQLMPLSVAATGHGMPMKGEALKEQLQQLATHFRQMAVPHHGRYVKVPAVADEAGVLYVPPITSRQMTFRVLLGLGIISLAALGIYLKTRNPEDKAEEEINQLETEEPGKRIAA